MFSTATRSQIRRMHTEGMDAMLNLLASERAYADALAIVCDVHIPLAQGKPASVPCLASVSPSKNQLGPSPSLSFTASNSSTGSQQFEPLMTSKDVAIVFRNIHDIASFSFQFIKRLETICCGVRDHEDEVGELFLEITPQLKSLYTTYLRAQPAAYACLQWLSTSPAYRIYHFNTLNFLSGSSQVPNLPSFLMKLEHRVPEYYRLLSTIHTASTLACHKGPTAPLARALRSMEEVARELRNDREANELPQLAARLDAYPAFLDELAERIKDLGAAMRRSIDSLQKWAITFGGAVFGSVPSSPMPNPFGYKAFTSLLTFLSELCITLEDDTRATLNPLLQKLKAMTENPKRLLNEIHALELPRGSHTPLARLQRRDTLKNYHYYLLLRSRLLSQLPVFLGAMDRAVGLVVRMVTEGFLKTVKEKWVKLFDSMMEEEEHRGGSGEILRAWQARWEAGQQESSMWRKVSLLGEWSVQDIRPSMQSLISLPARLESVTSAEPPLEDGVPSRFGLLCIPPKLRMCFSFPPTRSSRRSSRMCQSQVGDPFIPYTIRVVRSYSPPPHGPYRDHSFFNLVVGDHFEVVEEHDHPLVHADLPQCFVDKRDEDCLLKVRARDRGLGYETGDVGWVLARFVSTD